MGSENAHACAQNARNVKALTFLRMISRSWRWISHSHRTSNRWWNFGLIRECWNQRAVKAGDATHFPQRGRKKLKQTSSACQKADGNCFLWQGKECCGEIHATRDHNNVRSVMRNTKKSCVGPFRKKGVECWHPVYCSSTTMHVRTQALLEHFNWELSDHSPYSPDLAPSDCRQITYLKNWLGSVFQQ
jgi:hypothetical protein